MNLSRGVAFQTECSIPGSVCGGGLIHASGARTLVEASECIFEAGIAASFQAAGFFGGGAIYVTFGATLVLNNSIVRGNLAGRSGGGVMMFDETTLFMKGSVIERNWAIPQVASLLGLLI